MAISKTQPMRPAEIELVDEVNRLTNASSSQAGQIASLNAAIEAEAQVRLNAVKGLQDQIGNGFTETDITQSLSATNAQMLALTDEINAFTDKFIIACVNNLVIPANDSFTTTENFSTPFADDAKCILLAQVIPNTNDPSTLFNFTLIDCTYSGFSYSIANSDADSHTVSLGYIAVQVN